MTTGVKDAGTTDIENQPQHEIAGDVPHAVLAMKCKRGNFTKKLPLCRRDAEVIELKNRVEKRVTRGKLPADRRQEPSPGANTRH